MSESLGDSAWVGEVYVEAVATDGCPDDVSG